MSCSRQYKPVIFAFHGYPDAPSQADLSASQSRQYSCARLHRGRHTTTPFDTVVLNNLDRYQFGAGRHPADCTFQRSTRQGDCVLSGID